MGKKKPAYKTKYYYYMCEKEVRAVQLAAVLSEDNALKGKVEVWDDADIIEIATQENRTIDVERLELFDGETDGEFVRSRNINSIYSIRVDEMDETEMIRIFKQIVEVHPGFVCSDTDDFQPFLIS